MDSEKTHSNESSLTIHKLRMGPQREQSGEAGKDQKLPFMVLYLKAGLLGFILVFLHAPVFTLSFKFFLILSFLAYARRIPNSKRVDSMPALREVKREDTN